MLDFTGIAIDSMDNWLESIVTLVGGVIQAQFSPFAPIGSQAGGAPLRAGIAVGIPSLDTRVNRHRSQTRQEGVTPCAHVCFRRFSALGLVLRLLPCQRMPQMTSRPRRRPAQPVTAKMACPPTPKL